MFWSRITNFLNIPETFIVKRFYTKKPFIRRYGYEDKIFNRGLLPRSKDAPEIKQIPKYAPKNSWTPKRALFGQNDYIDILGSGNVHPVQLLTEVPRWLRGFRGNEFQILQRKMNHLGPFYEEFKPKKYQDMKRSRWHLYRYLNHKTKSAR